MSECWDAYVRMQDLKDEVIQAIDSAFWHNGTVLRFTLEFDENRFPNYEMETVKPTGRRENERKR